MKERKPRIGKNNNKSPDPVAFVQIQNIKYGAGFTYKKGRIPVYGVFIIVLGVRIIFYLLSHILTPFPGALLSRVQVPLPGQAHRLEQTLNYCSLSYYVLSLCVVSLCLSLLHFVSIEC